MSETGLSGFIQMSSRLARPPVSLVSPATSESNLMTKREEIIKDIEIN